MIARKRILIGLLVAAFSAGCNFSGGGPATTDSTASLPAPAVTTVPAPSPDAAAREFLEAWKTENYNKMYSLLTPLSQDGMSQEVFQDRYEEITRGGAIVDVDYEIVSSLVSSPQDAEVRYRVFLQSAVVGEIERETLMDLRRVDDNWRVAWTEATILPEFSGGYGLRLSPINPVRANIYDQGGLALASQNEAAALWITPDQIGDNDAEESMLSLLRRLFDLPTADPILERYDALRGTDFYVPLGEVALAEYQQVSEELASAGGVQARTYDTRYSAGDGLAPFAGGYAPHAIGYVSWIPEEELFEYIKQGYLGDEYVGRMGLEQAFESDLRGVPGGSLYLTDAQGTDLAVIASRDPEPPYAVYSTLDRDLQKVAQESLENFTGAVVVLARDTGRVLAMASSPAFDPNIFDPQNPHSAWGLGELNLDPEVPFLNRATLGLYPAGSVFKMITMAAALESGEFTPETVYNCGLEFREIPGIVLYDWRYGREMPASGELTLQGGLERSCNPWFYHIGLTLFADGKPSAISEMAKGFGLGQETGIELGDAAGLVPDPENKRALYGEDWLVGDPVQLAIGQSYLQVTPLQVARYVAAIGNGGTLYQPQIVERVVNAEGEVRQAFSPVKQGRLPVSNENLAAIQQAMVNVVEDPRATAYRRFLGLNLNVAGKTGTATTGETTDPHAWFAGYTFEEREDLPDIAVVVILENKGEGSEWAAPIFRRVLETYFKGRPISLFPWESRIRVVHTPEPAEGEVVATPTP
jgi:penicillin-binding protein 2